MQELGVNVIRSYNVDPTLNHDECMSIFNEAGIYALLDVNSPLSGQSIDRSAPYESYTLSYLEHIFGVVENFKGYENTLGFFAGNEVINTVATAENGNPEVIRAVVRDLKTYIKNNSDRQIPVGYSAADVDTVLADTWEYLQCAIDGDSDDLSRSDFFGLNDYEWCGGAATFTSSGYNVIAETFANSSIPVFFSEYGCNQVLPRVFDEVEALYGVNMTMLSGGLVYEWTQDTSDYGLVQVYSNESLQLLGDYVTLQAKYAEVNITLLDTTNSTATAIAAPSCAASLISSDGFPTNWTLPSAPSGASAIIASGISSGAAVTGSIVSVTQTSVQLPVYNTAGALITGLVIEARSSANDPGAVTATASSSTAKATAKSTSKSKGAAATLAPGAFALFVGAGALIL